MNLPNKLTVIRLICVPIFILVFLTGEMMPHLATEYVIMGSVITQFDILAFAIFVGASFTDYLDGHLARKQHLVTTFGKFVDPIADKLLVNSALILLAYTHRISVLIVLVMILRDSVVDAIRMLASQKNVVLAASPLGKAKTVFQMIGISLVLLNNIVFALYFPIDQVLMGIAAMISFISGMDYLLKNKDYILESM